MNSPFDWKSIAPSVKFEPSRSHKKGQIDRAITESGCRFKSTPVRVIHPDGNSQWYPNSSAAAREAGVCRQTVLNHLKSGKPVNGVTFIECGWEK